MGFTWVFCNSSRALERACRMYLRPDAETETAVEWCHELAGRSRSASACCSGFCAARWRACRIVWRRARNVVWRRAYRLFRRRRIRGARGVFWRLRFLAAGKLRAAGAAVPIGRIQTWRTCDIQTQRAGDLQKWRIRQSGIPQICLARFFGSSRPAKRKSFCDRPAFLSSGGGWVIAEPELSKLES